MPKVEEAAERYVLMVMNFFLLTSNLNYNKLIKFTVDGADPSK